MFRLKFNSEKIFFILCNCRRNFSCSRWLCLTHYDVLNLKQTCSQKDIREAYIKLCKENHPDCDEKDTTLHKKFLRISEAYKILSKPHSRRNYDQSIAYLSEDRKIKNIIVKDYHNTDDFKRTWNDPSFYHNRKEEFMNADPIPEDQYYGIKGIKRVSNATLFVILLMLSLISGFVQVITIKNSVMIRERRQLSEENARILREFREDMAGRSYEENIAELEKSYNENFSRMYPDRKMDAEE